MHVQRDADPRGDFSALFEELPLGAYRSLPDGRMLRANAALVQLNRCANEAELLDHVGDFAGQMNVQPGRRREFMRELKATGRVAGFESEVRRIGDGVPIWVRESAHLVRDADGQVLWYEGTVEEITDRVLADDALQRSEQRLQQLVSMIPGVVYRLKVHPGPRYSYSYISDHVQALYGLSPAEVLADGGALASMRHPDDAARIRALTKAASESNSDARYETRLLLRDGSEKWIQVFSSPAPMEDGCEVRIGVVFDITDRRQADTALREQAEQWKNALEASGDGVWDWRVQEGVALLSPQCQQMYGYAAGELTVDPALFDSMTHPDDVARMRADRDAHFAGRTTRFVNEHRVRHKDGHWLWVLARGMVIERDAASRPLRMVGTHTDITASKHAAALRAERDRAAAADLAKSQFLSRVSHELRTPLNAILGFAQLLELDPGDHAAGNPRQRGWVRQVLASGRHLLALMDDILELSSAQTGQLPMASESLPLRPVLDEVLAMLASAAQDAGVGVQVGWPDDSAVLAVRADRKRLKQIVINLLSNAIKYNRHGGQVWLAAERSAGGIEISVADTGAGLDQGQLARLFQPFERLGAQRGPVAGTGLGLALSRQLAEAMGGSIGVTSTPGEGSTFTLRLPPG